MCDIDDLAVLGFWRPYNSINQRLGVDTAPKNPQRPNADPLATGLRRVSRQ